MTPLTHERRRDSERGSALVIALLVILALTALGIVGMKHAAQEMTSTSNRRYRAQGAETGDAALRITAQQFARSGAAVHDYYMRWHNKRRSEFGRDTSWQSYELVRSSDFSGDNRIFGNSGNTHQSFESQQGTPAALTVTVRDKPRTSLKIPRGRDLNSGLCYWDYTFRVAASVGTVETNFDNLEVGRSLTGTASSGLATAIVGPMMCPDASGN